MSSESKRCHTCARADKFFDGCSVVNCPKRKRVTAQPSELDQNVEYLIAYAESGCSFKVPSNKE